LPLDETGFVTGMREYRFMNLSDLGEFGLIRSIQKATRRHHSPALIGIGDDAAALRFSASRTVLVTTDLLLENVHFDLTYTDYYSLGWKSAAVNLSDIAAMGGVPRFCLSALGIPSRIPAEDILDFYRGFEQLLRLHKTTLVGGDTCSSRAGLFISVTALGEASESRIITRAGARPGDAIFVTGAPGESAAGLELLQLRSAARGMRNRKTEKRNPEARLVERHLRPVPRVAEGILLARSGCASAMIDISDGLSSDLGHICEQSGVGAEVRADLIPVSKPLKEMEKRLSKPALQYLLSGGEDYELLFTVPRQRVKKLRSLALAATEIGTITKGSGMFVVDHNGRKQALLPQGYDHFPRRSL
jgi:thiamine-monophosphate kinase